MTLKSEIVSVTPTNCNWRMIMPIIQFYLKLLSLYIYIYIWYIQMHRAYFPRLNNFFRLNCNFRQHLEFTFGTEVWWDEFTKVRGGGRVCRWQGDLLQSDKRHVVRKIAVTGLEQRTPSREKWEQRLLGHVGRNRRLAEKEEGVEFWGVSRNGQVLKTATQNRRVQFGNRFERILK